MRSKGRLPGQGTNGRSKKRVKFDPANQEHLEAFQGSVSDDEPEDKQEGKLLIIFGDEEDDEKAEDLDERGNVKGLFDYSDEADYELYQREMDRREKKVKGKGKRVIISRKGEGEDDDEEEERRVRPRGRSEKSDPLTMLLGILSNTPQCSLQQRIMNSGMPEKAKPLVLARLQNGDMDKPKQLEWVEALLSIPFGRYIPAPVAMDDPKDKLLGFFQGIVRRFDEKVHGLGTVKEEIINYLGQAITAGERGAPRILALYGSPGVGKTYIIRTALAEVLGRPIKCINMGGIKDAVHFTGFDYTYSSARYGVLVQSLIDAGVMNPIICYEEIDKISETRDGADIQHIMMTLTDPEANNSFQDKYFAGIDIPFDKVLQVMTLNDPNLVHPILRNRLHLVKVPDPSVQDKILIGRKHEIPKICLNVGFDKEALEISDETLNYILVNYCKGDAGLRIFKRCLESIILRLNTIKLVGSDISGKLKEVNFPLVVSPKLVDLILSKPLEENEAWTSMYN